MRSFAIGAVIVLASYGLVAIAAAAVAEGETCGPSGSWSRCLVLENGGVHLGLSRRESSEPGPAAASDARRDTSNPLQIGAAFCAGANAAASGGASREVAALCRGIAVPVAPGRDLIRQAFKELPLYRGAIRTDPATLTLVNLETYFWCADAANRDCTTIGEAEKRITLLGQQVRIRPQILDYTWDFGDGTGQRITDGKATHEYRHATTATITLTLTWTADYALGNGPFQPINDTTTTTSPPRLLPIREAQAVIVR